MHSFIPTHFLLSLLKEMCLRIDFLEPFTSLKISMHKRSYKYSDFDVWGAFSLQPIEIQSRSTQIPA